MKVYILVSIFIADVLALQSPWFVQVVRDNLGSGGGGPTVCGGCLIHDPLSVVRDASDVVVTSASCVGNTPAIHILIIMGSEWLAYEGQKIAASRIIKNEGYSNGSFTNDLAIILLKSHVKFTKQVYAIPLAKNERSYDSSFCYADGFFTQPNVHRVEMEKVECGAGLRKRSLFCARDPTEAEEMCGGDTGTPYICKSEKNPQRFVLVGVASNKHCSSDDEKYSVFNSIIGRENWIQSHLR